MAFNPRGLAAVFTVIVLCAGCGKDPEVAAREYIKSGDGYVAQGKYPEAVVQYANAVQQTPRNGEARSKLADAHTKTGEAAKALAEYVRAADLLPQDAQAQLK